ncbi:AAA family ATPase [Sphingobacterium spiritivorum]|uniref:AAA family ATPase n=1 Tax=Sphingobacterium spiritivorum TaxID=258 RepID=UPI003DA3A4F4
MTNEQKHEIRLLTIDFVKSHRSQNQAAASLIGVSSATLTQVKNENWQLISDEMWHKLGKQVGYTAPDWVYTDTAVSKKIISHMQLARDRKVSNISSIIAPAGSGKTFTADYFASQCKDAILVKCKRGLTVRKLYKLILRSMGFNPEGYRMDDLEEMIYTRITKRANPTLILDEIDKANPEVWLELICLYNEFKDKCNIVTLSTPTFRTKIENGVRSGRLGFDELHSRLGGSFIDVGSPDSFAVAAISVANGVADPSLISKITESCIRMEKCDLRVGSDTIKAIKLKQNKAA